MNHYKNFEKLVKKDPEEVYWDFLYSLRSLFKDYLEGKVTVLTVARVSGLWFAMSDEFSEKIIGMDKRIKDLGAGIDLTVPGFSKARKRLIVKELLDRIEEILKNPKL